MDDSKLLVRMDDKLDVLDEKVDQVGLFQADFDTRLTNMEEWQKLYCPMLLEVRRTSIKNENDIKNMKWVGGGVAGLISIIFGTIISWLGLK